MNKFLISGVIVICVVVGTIFIKAKRVDNDHEPLLTPLSSIRPRSSPAIKKIVPPEPIVKANKIVHSALSATENKKTLHFK